MAGWIFGLPPGRVCLPSGAGWGLEVGNHVVFLMCHDVHATTAALEGGGVEFMAPITDEGYGLEEFAKD